MNKELIYKDLQMIITILIVVGLGFFVFNQAFAFYYKQYFLLKPCQLCEKINKNTVCVAKETTLTYDRGLSIQAPFQNDIQLKLILPLY